MDRFRSCLCLALLCGVSLPATLAGDSRVVLVSIDGLRPDAISAEWAPHLAWLRDSGASPATTLNDLPSATLPNHTTMLTGLPVSRHGVIENWNLTGHTSHATLFDYAAAAGKRSAFFAGKSKLGFLARPGSVETVQIDGDTDSLVEGILQQLGQDGPDLVFVHLRNPDSVGHQSDWMSSEYIDAVSYVDGVIGRLIDAVNAQADRPTYLIVTADHGGEGNNHFLDLAVNRTVPWIIYGPDTVRGTLSATFGIVDTTPTVLALLGVEPPVKLPGQARMEIKIGGASSGVAPIAPAIGAPCVILAAPFAIVGLHLLRLCLPARTARD